MKNTVCKYHYINHIQYKTDGGPRLLTPISDFILLPAHPPNQNPTTVHHHKPLSLAWFCFMICPTSQSMAPSFSTLTNDYPLLQRNVFILPTRPTPYLHCPKSIPAFTPLLSSPLPSTLLCLHTPLTTALTHFILLFNWDPWTFPPLSPQSPLSTINPPSAFLKPRQNHIHKKMKLDCLITKY